MATVERLRRALYFCTVLFVLNTVLYIVMVNTGLTNKYMWNTVVYTNYGCLLLIMMSYSISLIRASRREQSVRPDVVLVVERTRSVVPPGLLATGADLPPAYAPPGSEPPPPYLQTGAREPEAATPAHTRLTTIMGDPPRPDGGAADRNVP